MTGDGDETPSHFQESGDAADQGQHAAAAVAAIGGRFAGRSWTGTPVHGEAVGPETTSTGG